MSHDPICAIHNTSNCVLCGERLSEATYNHRSLYKQDPGLDDNSIIEPVCLNCFSKAKKGIHGYNTFEAPADEAIVWTQVEDNRYYTKYEFRDSQGRIRREKRVWHKI